MHTSTQTLVQMCEIAHTPVCVLGATQIHNHLSHAKSSDGYFCLERDKTSLGDANLWRVKNTD